MLIEELTLENIRCFEKATLKFKNKSWVTLLGQNGCQGVGCGACL